MGRNTSARDDQRRAVRRQTAFAQKIFETQQRIQKANEERAARQEELTNLSLGFTRDPVSGELVRTAPTAAQQRSEEIRGLLQDRELRALQGDLPVGEATENEIAEQEKQLRSRLQEIFGPQFEQTTGGRQALTKFQSAANERRDRERRGDIIDIGGQLTTRTGQGLTRTGLELSGIQGIPTPPPISPGGLPPVAPTAQQPTFLQGAAPNLGAGLGFLAGQTLSGPVGAQLGAQLGRGIGQGLGNIF